MLNSGWSRLLIAGSIAWAVCTLSYLALVYAIPYPSPFVVYSADAFLDDHHPPIRWALSILLIAGPVVFAWIAGFTIAWVARGFSYSASSNYLKKDRLPEVIALLQVLALAKFVYRSEDALTDAIGRPISGDRWPTVAGEHPELFRVRSGAKYGVSLVARHASGGSGTDDASPDQELLGKLVSTAIQLHQAQLRAAQLWHVVVPIIIALVSGAVVVLTAYAGRR